MPPERLTAFFYHKLTPFFEPISSPDVCRPGLKPEHAPSGHELSVSEDESFPSKTDNFTFFLERSAPEAKTPGFFPQRSDSEFQLSTFLHEG